MKYNLLIEYENDSEQRQYNNTSTTIYKDI